MNRKIKFRGKRQDTGEWVYGYYAVLHISLTDIDRETNLIIHVGTRTEHAIFNDERKGESGYWKDVIPETVGQFTGLHDKNGKEIYEGDILLDGYIKYEVWYSEDRSGFIAEMIDPQNNLVDYLGGYDTERIMTVIGNIHDNPELLKGGEA